MDRVRRIIGAAAAYEKGFYGQGITTAVLDTGTYPHIDLREQIVLFRDFINKKKTAV